MQAFKKRDMAADNSSASRAAKDPFRERRGGKRGSEESATKQEEDQSSVHSC